MLYKIMLMCFREYPLVFPIFLPPFSSPPPPISLFPLLLPSSLLLSPSLPPAI